MGSSCACGDSHEANVRKLNAQHLKLVREKELLELQRRNEVTASGNALLRQNVTRREERRADWDAAEVGVQQVGMTVSRLPGEESLRIVNPGVTTINYPMPVGLNYGMTGNMS